MIAVVIFCVLNYVTWFHCGQRLLKDGQKKGTKQQLCDTYDAIKLYRDREESADRKYDAKNRPLLYAEKALSIVQKIFGDGETYIHAKALAAVAKSHLAKKEREAAEESRVALKCPGGRALAG